jgi:ribosome assembly protein 4
MATLLPRPSKKRKVAASELARVQQVPELIPDGIIRVRFYDRATNEVVGPAVSVPFQQANTTNLNTIANSLQGKEAPEERIRYDISWEVNDKEGDGVRGMTLASGSNLWTELVAPGTIDAEGELALWLSPQAVFRVKAVSRCAHSISGHAQPILTAHFSPATAARLATGSGDNTARIWDCDTGTPLHTLKGHTGWVLCVVFSPDNSMVATGSYDNTVRLWEAETGKPLGLPYKGHSKFIRSMAWEPFHLEEKGRPRVASSSKDGTVRVWDIVGHKTDFALTGHKASVSCVRWGGTGLLYTASQDKTIKIWESKEGRLLHTLQAHAHWVNHLALSTDFVLRTAFHDHTGQVPKTMEAKIAKSKERFTTAATIGKKIVERLVSASDDNILYLWDPLSDNPTKPIAKMLGHQKPINHVTFSPNGHLIASASFDNSVKLWNARDGSFIHTLRGHVAPVYRVVFSPDSSLLVSGSRDTTLKCWDVRTGKLMKDLPGHQDEVFAVDWSPDGTRVGSGGKDKVVKTWTF